MIAGEDARGEIDGEFAVQLDATLEDEGVAGATGSHAARGEETIQANALVRLFFHDKKKARLMEQGLIGD